MHDSGGYDGGTQLTIINSVMIRNVSIPQTKTYNETTAAAVAATTTPKSMRTFI